MERLPRPPLLSAQQSLSSQEAFTDADTPHGPQEVRLDSAPGKHAAARHAVPSRAGCRRWDP